MKRLLLSCVTIVLMLASLQVSAQDRTVSGRVTSVEDGSPLPGVSVVLKGTAVGTQTDGDGRYSLSVPEAGGTLTFSFISFKTTDVAVTNQSSVDLVMELDAAMLNEVVVTALNVSTDVKKIPYSAQTVSSAQLNMTRSNNVNDALAGKVAGIQVRGQSGAALGRNSSIRIRGAGSFTDKEPLYVVDGTPVTNSQDFNPDDIENVTVLKGPSATALYGQRGDAGVILVTTKKGKKGQGVGISLNHNTFFDNVYILPKYQNSYAGGSYADLTKFNFQDGMPTEWQSLDGKYYHDYTDDASWGPRMNGQEYIPWYAWLPGTKYTGKTASLNPQPNNVRDFYETGVNTTTNVAFSQANDFGNVRLSVTNQNQSGVMPETGLKKNTVALNTTVNLSKVFSVGANINYVNTVINGEFDDAYSNQSSGSFNQWFHRDLDMGKLKELSGTTSPGGRYSTWNHFNPEYYMAADGTGVKGDKFYRGVYWHNPYTYFKQIDYQQTRNRFFGDVNLTVNILKNLKAAVFYRKNQNTTYFENKRPSILPYSFYTENRPTGQEQWDYYGTNQTFAKEDNLEFLLTYNETFMNDKLTLDLMGGGNIRSQVSSTVSMETSLGLAVPDLFTISNSKETFRYSNPRSQKKVRSLYAQGTLGYNNMLFVNFSVRNDWSSALPASDNSYIYPMVGASFAFSELTQDALPFLSFGKLRASWAQVGSDLDPYSTALTYGLSTAGPWNGNVLGSTPDKLPDPNIRPSLSSSVEFGLDLKFFKNRLGIGLTYFDEAKKDEILDVGVSGSSGFTQKTINAGELERKGIEIQIDATPVQVGDFRWDATLNFAKITSTIVKLAPGIDAIPASSLGTPTFAQASTFHVEGKEWGQLRGNKILRNEDGVPILNDNGTFKPTEDPQDYGSVLPDFTGGFLNSLSYKRFSVNFNIDFQKGGQFYSLSEMYGEFSGLLKTTAGVNDKGIPVRDAVVDGGGVHVKGVDVNGEKVDTYVDAQTYFHQFNGSIIPEPYIHDLTFVKLRELSIGYQIPVKNLGRVGKIFTNASVSLVGRNLWLMYSDVKNFDPAEISGAFGENGQFPSTRSMGFNIKLGF